MTCTCTPMSTCAECAAAMVTDAMVFEAAQALWRASQGDIEATPDEMRAALVAALTVKEKIMSELPPLPEPDGTAEANKEPHPDGGYTYDEVDAWSEPLVRAYAAAAVAKERERCAKLCDERAGPLRTGAYDALIAAAEAIRATQATPQPPAAS